MTIRRGLVYGRTAALIAPWLLVLCSCSNSGDSPGASTAAPAAAPPAAAPPAATPPTATPPIATPPIATPAAPEQACQIEPVQHVVGSPYTPELGEQVRELSGSTVVRVLHPGEVVTMEFRFDRVNITVDDAGAITQVTCG